MRPLAIGFAPRSRRITRLSQLPPNLKNIYFPSRSIFPGSGGLAIYRASLNVLAAVTLSTFLETDG
jgi:hypothetical protein